MTAPMLMTPKEAAGRLAISEDLLREHVHRGDIKSVIIGHGQRRPRRRFTEQDLQDFIEARRGVDIWASTKTKERASSITTSNSKVIGFMARAALETERKLKESSKSVASSRRQKRGNRPASRTPQ
ncbi:excisionase family DNA binding protein [Rhodoligotrophos appendicifer]|uniref:helix-turn-helix domain-containing protein n=1 Tax=Rhodoligotrophos appendicifer TaxID=987056 RepID=UPI0014783670|nr:helix-turn-helix domain-containing protein [Rhodoligotrophos appendicifer]